MDDSNTQVIIGIYKSQLKILLFLSIEFEIFELP